MLVHDASYHVAIQLEGPEAGIYFTFYLINLFVSSFSPLFSVFSSKK